MARRSRCTKKKQIYRTPFIHLYGSNTGAMDNKILSSLFKILFFHMSRLGSFPILAGVLLEPFLEGWQQCVVSLDRL